MSGHESDGHLVADAITFPGLLQYVAEGLADIGIVGHYSGLEVHLAAGQVRRYRRGFHRQAFAQRHRHVDEQLLVGGLGPGAVEGRAAFVFLGGVFLAGGDVAGIGIRVAIEDHMADTGRFAGRLHRAADPHPGHHGELGGGAEQFQLADAEHLDRQHRRRPGVGFLVAGVGEDGLFRLALHQFLRRHAGEQPAQGREERIVAFIQPQRAWTVFGATGGQTGADGRGAQLARLAVGELRADRQAGEVDETEARIQFAEHFLLGLAGDLVGLGELAQTDLAGVVELVVEGTGAGLQVQVGRQVAGIGLGEGGDETALAADVVLPVIGGVALVVRGDQVIGVGHRGAVHREPTDRAGQLAVGVDEAEHAHLRVDAILVAGDVRILQVRQQRAVAAGVAQLAAAVEQAAGLQPGLGPLDGADDAVDDGVEGLFLEAEHRQVVHRVVGEAARTGVGVGGGEHHVVFVVDTGVLRLEPGQNLQVHGLEDHPQVGVDVDQATSAGRFLDHEGTRPLAHVDAGGLLFEGGVTHHADFGGFAGDVRLAQAEAVGQVVGPGRHGERQQDAGQQERGECGT